MGLRIGIVGLPNAGKSTTFNALTQTQNARVASYPFCTIEPNRAVVPVPDWRLDKLASLTGVPNRIHATVEFVDIAGLVKGAHQGEGLGNQFLGDIRNTDAILHVVRCFDDPNVSHVSEEINPTDDIENINLELILADLQQLERKIERLERKLKADKRFKPVLELAAALQDHLGSGQPIRTYLSEHPDILEELNNEMRFLTAKPVLYLANVDEAGLEEESVWAAGVREIAAGEGAPVVIVCARLEEEFAGLSDEERKEFMALAGIEESGLDQVVRLGYATLGLISFFTMNESEVRSWAIPAGTFAPAAAGVIHTDFERGFIKAEVIPFDVFDRFGSIANARAAGAVQIEGKGYVVEDGDVIYFRFNV